MHISFFLDTRLTFIFSSQVFGTVPEKSDDESDNQPTTTTLQLLREQRAQKTAAAAASAAEEAAATSESGGTSITLNTLSSTTLTESSLSLEPASGTSNPQPSVRPSSPLALAQRSLSFSPARHTNTHTDESPAPRPVKFT